MSWLEDLRDASFRGVPFDVLGRMGGPVGRRVQVDVFPFRDKARSVDLGGLPESFAVDAVIIGPDYMSGRDRLLEALRKPGGGELIHPTLGRKWVVLTGGSYEESTEEGGICRFSLEFTEVEERRVTNRAEDTSATSRGAAASVAGQAQESFGNTFSVASKPSWIRDEAVAMIAAAQAKVDDLASSLSGYGSAFNGFIADGNLLRSGVLSLVLAPVSLATSISGIVQGLRRLARTPAEALGLLKSLMRFGSTLDASSAATPLRAVAASNQTAVVHIVRRVAAAEAVLAATDMTFASYQDAVAVRDSLADQLDELALEAADAGDDDAWQALNDARTAVIRDIATRGADLARLYSYTPKATEPSLVIAYRLYGADQLEDRAAEIVSRNRVQHPGFVHGGEVLEVLSV